MAKKEKNKVKYGLENVYFAMVKNESASAVEYDTPIHIPGAVSLSLTPRGDAVEFYADNRAYFEQFANDGYEGDLVVALLPDEFLEKALGERNDGGLMVEDASVTQKPFALLFEFMGDKSQTRHVLFYCTANRPNISSQTKAKSLEVLTETLNIKISQRPDTKLVRARTTPETDDAAYNGWFSEVPNPTAAAPTEPEA